MNNLYVGNIRDIRTQDGETWYICIMNNEECTRAAFLREEFAVVR